MKSTWKLLNMAIGTQSKTTNIVDSFTTDEKDIEIHSGTLAWISNVQGNELEKYKYLS